MHLSQNLRSGRSKYLFGLLLLVFIFMICAAFSSTANDDFDVARREVLLRKIGHELLLKSGDSTSRVLPVQKIAENNYRIVFENDFSFQPEALVNITQRLLTQDVLASDYIVSVLKCDDGSIVYQYAVSKNKKDDIITCIGRKQPKACYKISIEFKSTGIYTAGKVYLLGCLSLLAFIGFIFIKPFKSQKVLPEIQEDTTYTLGSVLFDANNKKLVIKDKTIELTRTETRVLLIFAASPNETIAKSRLQKEIWEDEGVVVGRSLDMFISKLRKKLESDPNINIVVIRSKGYKLEISNQ